MERYPQAANSRVCENQWQSSRTWKDLHKLQTAHYCKWCCSHNTTYTNVHIPTLQWCNENFLAWFIPFLLNMQGQSALINWLYVSYWQCNCYRFVSWEDVCLSYIIIRVFCVCVCLPVCLSNLRYQERKVVSPRCLCHLEELRLARCINCFSSLYDMWFERNMLWKFFCQLRTESLAHTVTFPVTLGKMNLAHYNKAFVTFSKGMRWRTCLPNCFSSLSNAPFERKSLWKFSPVTRSRFLFRLPWAGWIWPTTRKTLNILEGYVLKDTGTIVATGTIPSQVLYHHGYYSCYCYLYEWAIYTSQSEKLITW